MSRHPMRVALLVLAALAVAWSTAPDDDAAPTDAPRVLTTIWHPEHGGLSVATPGGNRLVIGPAALGSSEPRLELTLATLSDDVEIVEALALPFVMHGLAVALVVKDGTRHEYRYLTNRRLTYGDVTLQAREDDLVMGDGPDDWLFTDPIFSEEGEPFRLVELSSPGGDSLVLGFRRGSLRHAGKRAVEQKLFVDTCPASVDPIMPGRTGLYEVSVGAH